MQRAQSSLPCLSVFLWRDLLWNFSYNNNEGLTGYLRLWNLQCKWVDCSTTNLVFVLIVCLMAPAPEVTDGKLFRFSLVR